MYDYHTTEKEALSISIFHPKVYNLLLFREQI